MIVSILFFNSRATVWRWVDVRSLGSQRPQRREGSAGEHGGCLRYIPTVLALLKVLEVTALLGMAERER